ncbi:MAG: hypothetical protein K6F94_07410 [Bacteroidaceae bacterium]|nr:hypothetical protein [Bacteroidaceae bacterium]
MKQKNILFSANSLRAFFRPLLISTLLRETGRLSAVLSLFLFFLLPASAVAESYSKMWKRVQKAQEAGTPQTAYRIASDILKKAEHENAKGQLISARLLCASLRQEWAPDSFFTDIHMLESARAAATDHVTRSVYASVLGEIYRSNRYRSQASALRLQASDIREWTQEQYDSASAENFRLSLSYPLELAEEKSEEWLPFISKGEQSSYFGHDLLHLLWTRALDMMDSKESRRLPITQFISVYRSRKNRDAEMLMLLDSVNLLPASHRATNLQTLIRDFRDRPVSVEACLSLLDNSRDTLAVSWAEESLQQHPRYERSNLLRERIYSMRQPRAILNTAEVYYPEQETRLRLQVQNVSEVTLETFRLSEDFDEGLFNRSKNRMKYLKAHAALINSLRHPTHNCSEYKLLADSVLWKTPQIGRYALVVTSTTDSRNVTSKKAQDIQFFAVSTLHLLFRYIDETKTAEMIVVDSETGSPIEGASVSVFRKDRNKRLPTKTVSTNREGRAHFNAEDKSAEYILSVTKGEDKFLPSRSLWTNSSYTRTEESQKILHLFSDRSIYRPGQTVRISGIAYEQLHWATNVLAYREISLTLRDTNYKEISRRTIRTDSLGVLSAEFPLPPSCLPGSFSVSGDMNASLYFSVEEYKRPTFEVITDKAPALIWPQDSITVTGRALGYNGVPIRDGKVVSRYRLTYPYLWYHNPASELFFADTVRTGDDGRFSIRLPLKGIKEDELKKGFVISLDIAVTSASGETREGSTRIPVCIKPLRLSIIMPAQQERSDLKPIRFNAVSSTGEPVPADIFWRIDNHEGETVTEWTSGDPLPTISQLPSGSYKMSALARHINDSARAESSFYLFSLTDTRLPSPKEFWSYCPSDTFEVGRPVSFQVGSSLHDVSLYYSIITPRGEYDKKLIQFSDSVMTFVIPYDTAYGDGVTLNVCFVKRGKVYSQAQRLYRALPEKRLKWQWRSFRDRLHPGDRETWTLRLTHHDGKPAAANMMATVYDASLDAIRGHSWPFQPYLYHNIPSARWSYDRFRIPSASVYINHTNKSLRYPDFCLDYFNPRWTEGLAFAGMFGRRSRTSGGHTLYYTVRAGQVMKKAATPAIAGAAVFQEFNSDAMMVKSADGLATQTADSEAMAEMDVKKLPDENANPQTASSAAKYIRTDFNETAAFIPHLHTDNDGVVTVQFTLPESLTTWRLLGIAHTNQLDQASIEAEIVTHKELMAQINMPRFLRVGDRAVLTASIQNLTDKPINGRVTLEIFNPETERVISKQKTKFSMQAQSEQILSFTYMPKETGLMAVRLSAESKDFSDGEQHYLAILSDKEQITESVEMRADSSGTFHTGLKSLFNNNSKSATDRRLTVEYTTNPIWYAIQALPALREPRYSDALSVASDFYANRLAVHIAKSEPRIKSIVEIWQKEEASPSLRSRLQQNEELKNIILEVTPWLREAESDQERKRSLIELFQDDYQLARMEKSIAQLLERQNPDGSFSWFPGMKGSEYVTRNIALLLTRLKSICGQLDVAGAPSSSQTDDILNRAVTFLASETARDVDDMKKMEKKGEIVSINSLSLLHYIYITQHSGISLDNSRNADINYILRHIAAAGDMDNEARAMSAIIMQTLGRKTDARAYLNSLKEHMTTGNQGAFLDYAGGSFISINRKLHTHTAAIEAIRAVSPSDHQLLSQMRRWLLRQKRTQMWASPLESADAIFALISSPADSPDAAAPTTKSVLSSNVTDRLCLKYKNGKMTVVSDASANSTAALGYIKQHISDPLPVEEITVERHSSTEGWGAVYAQYMSPVSAVSASQGGLKVRREFSSLSPSVGDVLTIRYVITADRDYEYVCLSSERPACAEPSSQISGYNWQGGLGYYCAVRDARTEYFFDRLPKGTYVIEERTFADRRGTYSAGLCRLQSLYAPEYNAHAASSEISVK